MPKFNPSQLEAISAENQSILVSAAAGSGKTTVMVEKIKKKLINHPEASISQFLVITFTRDAAQNMKDKLRGLLEDAAQEGVESAGKALSEIEIANISTIHSFCTQLLKEYNDNSGSSMNPRVLKDTEKKRMLDESFFEAVEAIFEKDSSYCSQDKKAVSGLLLAFTPEELNKMVQDLYNTLMGIADPFDFLTRVIHTMPVHLWNQEILTSIDLDVLSLKECLRQEKDLLHSPLSLPAYDAVVQKDTEIAEDFLANFETAENPEDKRSLLEAAKAAFEKAPIVRGLDDENKAWKKQIDKIRDSMKGAEGILGTAIKRLSSMSDENNEYINSIIQRELQGLELLLRETASQYEQQKTEAGAIDYSDMEQIAYRIMSDPDKRNELLAKYKYIYVDECQDVSGIQNAIIKSLTSPKHQFFMVGDIKQSIYGFRHAEPDLFEHERQTYSDEAEASERRIFFMDNYRSCRSIVDAVNEVFTEAMEHRITDMDYLPEDNLRCNLEGEYGPVDVILVKKGEEEADKLETQCEAAGKYIQSLLPAAPEASIQTNYQYKDIVILVRNAKGSASAIVEHLKRMHIPAMYEGIPDFFGLAEVKSFLSLLTVIDNLHNDDALVGTLINTPFLFSDSDLTDIRLEKLEHVPFYEAFELCVKRNEKPIDQKCHFAADQLAAWRKVSEGMSVPDFVWWLMRETGIYAARGAYPDGKARQANLDALYQRALDGQKAGNLRLSDFIRDLREARETKQIDSDDHPALGADDNFVRVMTMHKSKGLEFPVVILMDLQKSIRRKPRDEKLRMNVSSSSDALGLYLPAVQRKSNSILDSQGKEAFEFQALRKRISEETRVLYVAMTRARQKLCLIGSVKDGEEDLWRNRTRAARIWKTRSMLDMIMPAVLKRVELPETDESKEDAHWRLSCVSGKTIEDNEDAASISSPEIQQILDTVEPMLMYVPEPVESTPLKTSVTTLSRQKQVLSVEDSEETVADKRKAEESVRTFRLSTAPSCPAFLKGEKAEAVDIGTATHRFLHLIDLDFFRRDGIDFEQAVQQEAERIQSAGILTEEELSLIHLHGVASFLKSRLGQRMLKSKEIKREASFTMRIDPHEPTMVQGIVDCVFKEGGKWILIDYKTDRDTDPETFVPRHEAQMNWYRTAIERLTHISVREMWLFALRAGKAYSVERKDVFPTK